MVTGSTLVEPASKTILPIVVLSGAEIALQGAAVDVIAAKVGLLKPVRIVLIWLRIPWVLLTAGASKVLHAAVTPGPEEGVGAVGVSGRAAVEIASAACGSLAAGQPADSFPARDLHILTV